MNNVKGTTVLAVTIFAVSALTILVTGGCGKNESTPLPTQDQKDVMPDEVSSHNVLYQEGVDVTIVKDGKPVMERIAVYGVAGLRFPARNLTVDRRAKLTTTIIIIEAAKGGFLVPNKDSAVPVNMGFDKSAKFGLSFFTHAINTTWKFAKPGIRFNAVDSTYESERAGASISFTEDGVKMDGLKRLRPGQVGANMGMYIIWGIFGIFAILQATRVSKIKNKVALAILFLLGPFGFLYCYFLLPRQTANKE